MLLATSREGQFRQHLHRRIWLLVNFLWPPKGLSLFEMALTGRTNSSGQYPSFQAEQVLKANLPCCSLEIQRGLLQSKDQQHLIYIGNSWVLKLALPRKDLIHSCCTHATAVRYIQMQGQSALQASWTALLKSYIKSHSDIAYRLLHVGKSGNVSIAQDR